MTLESQLQQILEGQAEIKRQLDRVIALQTDDREVLDRLKRESEVREKLAIGTKLYGYCGGMFRSGDCEYGDKTIIGVDWMGSKVRIRVQADHYDDEFGRRHGDMDYEEFDDWEDASSLIEYTVERPEPEHDPSTVQITRYRTLGEISPAHKKAGWK